MSIQTISYFRKKSNKIFEDKFGIFDKAIKISSPEYTGGIPGPPVTSSHPGLPPIKMPPQASISSCSEEKQGAFPGFS